MLCASSLAAQAQSTFQRTPKGVMYTIYTHSTAPKIKANDVITINVIQKTDKDSVFFSSYTAGKPIKLQVQPSQTITDLMEVFPLLAPGDSALMKIPSDSVFKGHEESRPPFLPKGSNLNFVVKIVNVQSLDDAMAEQKAEMAKMGTDEAAAANKYIINNKLAVTTTASGLKYVVTKAGLKPKPLKGDTVYVNYTGKLLNGKVFDSSIQAIATQAGLNQPGRTYEPISFPVGTSQVIKGWDEGLLLLHEGSKATFVIPSSLAYGAQGGGDAIPPFSTLVFDVELVKVKRIKHAPVAPTATKKPMVHHTPVKKKS